jgi:hypothetical protein
MTQVTTVRAVPVSSNEEKETMAAVVEGAAKIVERTPDWKRRAWLYYGTQKLETMSNRQLKGALKRVQETAPSRQRYDRDDKSKPSYTGVAMATVLEVLLDTFTKGGAPYPR